MDIYQAEYAGIPVRYRFRYPLTRMLFWDWMRPVPDGTSRDAECVEVPEEVIENGRKHFPEDAAPENIEFKALIDLTSRVLLSSAPVCVFHAVAVSAFGKAWLITAPSGVGKTTQLKNWRLMRDVPEVGVISGDMPVLERLTDGSVLVHPSPWNGKEGYRGADAAPLGGIICLERLCPGGENSIRLLEPKERLDRCLRQFVCLPGTVEQTERLARLADAALSLCPVWLLRNRGDAESTALMIKTIEQNSAEGPQRPAEAAGDGSEAPAVSEPLERSNTQEMPESAPGEVRYRRRGGIVLEKICGEYLLMADAGARKTVPFIAAVNESSAVIWDCLGSPGTPEKCTVALAAEYPDADPDLLRDNTESFLNSMTKAGYLISE